MIKVSNQSNAPQIQSKSNWIEITVILLLLLVGATQNNHTFRQQVSFRGFGDQINKIISINGIKEISHINMHLNDVNDGIQGDHI